MRITPLDIGGFRELLRQVSASWAACDAEAAAALFTEDAVYMEPPDIQLFQGRDQLAAYFSPLVTGTYLDIHSVWFDPDSQTGAAEFSFGVRGQTTADHGVVILTIRDGLIASWREYQRKGPAGFQQFIAPEDKAWQWHIGNYP